MTARTRLTIIALFLLLQALDVVTTYYGLRAGAVEANPVAAWALVDWGEPATYAVKLALAYAVLSQRGYVGRGWLRWASWRGERLWIVPRAINVIMVVVVAVNLTALL